MGAGGKRLKPLNDRVEIFPSPPIFTRSGSSTSVGSAMEAFRLARRATIEASILSYPKPSICPNPQLPQMIAVYGLGPVWGISKTPAWLLVRFRVQGLGRPSHYHPY